MAITRITKGVIKPNENYDTHNINSTGIVTAIGLDINGNADVSGSLSVGGVLTYEDVTSIDSVGIITARTGLVSPYADIDDFVSVGNNIHLGNAGVITATSFEGDGSSLTGIDATALKDTSGNVKVQAQASGAVHSGISTFNEIQLGDTKKIQLGNSQDLQIYHDSNHSYIDDAGTGNLRLRSGTLEITNLASNKTSAVFSSGGGQTLNFNNNTKFVTTNTGAIVTGVITATTFSGAHTGDGSELTGISGFSTALSNDTASLLNQIFKTNNTYNVGAGTSVTIQSDIGSGNIAFTRLQHINVGTGATVHVAAGTTFIMNVLNVF